MSVEIDQALPNDPDQLHLMQEYGVQRADVVLNVRPRLIYIMQQHHLLLHKIDHIVYVLSVAPDQVLFFFQDHLYQLLVINTDTIYIIAVLAL